MYPDLSYFFHDVLGTDVDNWTSIFKTFGFMLVMALIACGILLKSELQRLEREGKIQPQSVTGRDHQTITYQDVALNSIFLTILIAKTFIIAADFHAFSANPAGILFSKNGNWIAGLFGGFAFAGYQYWAHLRNQKEVREITVTFLPSTKTNDIIIIAGLSGVLGSKLFSVLEDLPSFFQDPTGTFLSGSGLNVYGGLIVAFITVYIYVKRIGINPVYMMDISGMGILLGYAIGRMGCQLSGDGDWGIEAAAMPNWWFLPDWLWSYHYPSNVNNEGVLLTSCDPQKYQAAIMSGLSVEQSCESSCGMRYCHTLQPRVYPTPIYETVFGLLAFTIMYIKRRSFHIAGSLFFTYMIINGIERFLIELIRVNEKHELFGLQWSQAQYISVLFVLGGIGGLTYLFNSKPSN